MLSYLLLAGSTIGLRPWTVTALPSVKVYGRRSSVQSVCQWGVFIVWTILGVTIVRKVTIVRINPECGLSTCVLRTTFLSIIKRTGYVTRNTYADCHVSSRILLRITTYIQRNYDNDVRNIHNSFGISILTLALITPEHR